MAPWLRAIVALTKERYSVPTGGSHLPVNPSPEQLESSDSAGIFLHRHMPIYRHTYIIKYNENKYF